MSSPAALSIGLASPCWPASAAPNGIITYVSGLESSLSALGHQVSILSLARAEGGADPRIYEAEQEQARRSVVRRVADSLAFRLDPQRTTRRISRRAVVAAARRMLAERALDVFEMEESFGTAAWVQEALPIPVCVRLHGPWFLTGGADAEPDDPAFRRRVRAEGRALSAAAVVSAPAHDVLERVRARYQLPLAGAEVIPNPVQPAPPAERWTLDGCRANRVLFVGRFERLKGGDLVVDAFAEVLRRFPDARLCLVGPDGNVPGPGGRAMGLEAWVRESLPGALESGRVEWLGVKAPSDIGPLRREAMVTVVPSRYETFSYTVAEAMAQGCPVVAAEVGGIRDLLRDGDTGLFHRPGDAADLAAKILTVLADPTRAAAMGERAALHCEREFSPEMVARRQVALYRRVIAEHGARLRAG